MLKIAYILYVHIHIDYCFVSIQVKLRNVTTGGCEWVRARAGLCTGFPVKGIASNTGAESGNILDVTWYSLY